MHAGIFYALAAAALFGASTPFAKRLADDLSPALLSGLLYLGAGMGVGLARLLRDRGWRPSGLATADWPWMLGSVLIGGMIAPLFLMVGLQATDAAVASLLLNVEAVFTALIAWRIFGENADRRIVCGMVAIVAGGALLSWSAAGAGQAALWGPLAVIGACLCWAVDNNLTRKISAGDALFITSAKGWIAGLTNVALALAWGAPRPDAPALGGALLVGLVGYGVSMALFVLALRALGTARTGAYFATAPFIGAAVSLALLEEATPPFFWAACGSMALGVWLHLTERHDHEHRHEPMEHSHRHRHDAHHQHDHAFAWDGVEPHAHRHSHEAMTHRHPHYPDIHHRHPHQA